jgi:hypothetical protein
MDPFLSNTPGIRARNNRRGLARNVFYVVRAMPGAMQRSCKHTFLISRDACFPWCPPRGYITSLLDWRIGS